MVNAQKSVKDRYNKLELREQILLRPDTYIGSIEQDSFKLWVRDEETDMNVFKSCSYVPGLYKIYDEIVVNAKDHTVRDETCTTIRVTINDKSGEITCFNDGNNGVPVEIHPTFKIWVPELIFGNLLTSENYDDSELKYVGGKNGFGAKLANIYSTKFTVEVFDAKNKKHYVQNFYDNMSRKEDPVIKVLKTGKSSYLKISFFPDFSRFNIKKIDDDTLMLFKKRVYDIAACTGNNIKVYLDEELINIKDFKEYIKMFFDDESKKIIYESPNPNWKVGAIFTPDGYQHISYVNGICTFSGGTHVNHVLDKIINHILKVINDKDKNIKVTPAQIKENITIFIDALIDKPSFNSQIKEEMTTKISNFDTRCELSDEFLKKFAKTGIVESVLEFAKLKEQSGLKKINGAKLQNIHVEKLDDAHWAGTKRSNECRLILTEGDSAKVFAISGLEEIGKERYGVFPLKGKPMNVRETAITKIKANEEIKNIITIMGLKFDKKYEDAKEISSLRYGGIVIIADQDLDGSHIKGLLINFIERFWPALVSHMDYDFIQTLPTPIVKVWLRTDKEKKNVKSFYTLSAYNTFMADKDSSKYYIKYYKGLGTFVKSEAVECFEDYDKKVITYTWDKKDNAGKITQDVETEHKKHPSYVAIDLAFSVTKRDPRKRWLEHYDKDDIIENSNRYITYSEFIHKDLKHFSFYDNARSIPSICDMFKPSTRKIMYSAFLRKKMLTEEIKVSQFAGYVSQISAYHHGEKSLEGAIIGLAQNFVGSNNVNFLKPNGEFGTRMLMGKDHASSRYIFTQISEITPLIYRPEDNCILKYLYDDGKRIEPENYIPIIPTILLNGGEGIGTGFSCTILPHYIMDIIANIRNMINKKPLKEMTPWFRGFNGLVNKLDKNSYETTGRLDYLNDTTIRITELPIGIATSKYMDFLKSILVKDPKSKEPDMFESVIENNNTGTIDIKIVFSDNVLSTLNKSGNLLKKLKLITKFSSANMHLHSCSGTLKKYNSVNEIFKEFYDFRLSAYVERKKVYLQILRDDLDIIKWKVKFLELYLEGKIILEKRKMDNVFEQLEKLKFPKFYTGKAAKGGKDDGDEDGDEDGDDNDEEDVKNKKKVKGSPSYNYLKMSIFSITEDKMQKLKEEFEIKSAVYKKYASTSVEEMWLAELAELEKKYPEWLIKDTDKPRKNKNKVGAKVPAKRTKKA
jgi:DNA topoisomerase II